MIHTEVILREGVCNCGDRIRHANGGNYHPVDKLHVYTDDGWVVVLERTTTREDFPLDEFEYLVNKDGRFVLVPERYTRDIESGGPVPSFRDGEAEILAQSARGSA